MQAIIDKMIPEIIRVAGNQYLTSMGYMEISGSNEPPRERKFVDANGAVVAVLIVLAFVVVVLTLLVAFCVVRERRMLAREKAREAEAGSPTTTSDDSDDDTNARNNDHDTPRKAGNVVQKHSGEKSSAAGGNGRDEKPSPRKREDIVGLPEKYASDSPVSSDRGKVVRGRETYDEHDTSVAVATNPFSTEGGSGRGSAMADDGQEAVYPFTSNANTNSGDTVNYQPAAHRPQHQQQYYGQSYY